MTQPAPAPRPWCLPCRSEGSRVWAEHLGVACDWHYGILSGSDQEKLSEAVLARHPRGGRVWNHIEQIVVVRMDLRQQSDSRVEQTWIEDAAEAEREAAL